ncbi:MAG: hypothetical protein KatS3mg081_2633 [Gemmatimonadales bacterium]|nr:MAG: hypothetical protein KatS3mg081_2633 [Gemmatimonadales bacterium]
MSTFLWRAATFRLLSVGALALLQVDCATVQTTQPTTVRVTRRQINAYLVGEIHEAAATEYGTALQKAASRERLDADGKLLARVPTIMSRLVPHTTVFNPEAPSRPWEVHVTTSDDLVDPGPGNGMRATIS